MRTTSLLILILALPLLAEPAENLTCLDQKERAEANLYDRLRREAYSALDKRLVEYEKLDSKEKILAYQKEMRAFFIRQLGGFPERCPLNAKTVGTIEADGYTIEKVIFQSQPNHHITANLYLPKGKGRFPGVVVSSGHSRTAKTADYNQRFGIALVKHGMAVLCFDPIGQGERSQILDPEGKPRFKSTTTEHTLIGVGSILVGRNTARYRIWDGIRAIDYLESRPDIDSKRIGYTGCSGGGTLTSYVMALDPRVRCAAPSCYLTTFRRLIETIGPQDAEQNIYAQLAHGMDHPDYVMMRAPRPTLISATTGDYFSIRGAWENFRQAKRLYGRLGFPERVDLVEVPGKHGVQPQNLATITHWFQRWLLDRDEPVTLGELKTRPADQLLCTDSGQVLTRPNEQSVFDLNSAHAEELAKQRMKTWSKLTDEQKREKIRSVLGVRTKKPLQMPKVRDVGRVQRKDYHIDKLVFRTKTGVVLPGLTYHPETPFDDAYLYLHDTGKLGDGKKGGPIEKIVGEGYVVVSVDLSGQGETTTGKSNELFGDQKTYFLSYLLGKPLLGLRVDDALSAGTFVGYYEKPKKPRKVHLVGVGQAGVVALHAAALHPELFETVTLRNCPKDWASVLNGSVPSGHLENAVHGVLGVYDLPDLVQLVGKKLRIEP